MFDHVGIQCADVAASERFYDTVFAPLGIDRVMEHDGAIGYGTDGKPYLWIGQQETGEGFRESHLAFTAPSRDAVRAFFANAVAAGAEVLYEPQEWPYHPGYYAAFVRDPDGNNVEAACHLVD